MEITVRLFAILRERAGARELTLELPDGARVGDALAALGDKPLLQRGNWDTTALLSVMIGEWQAVTSQPAPATC